MPRLSVDWKKYALTPVSKPRQTTSDRWKVRPAVAKYRLFADCARMQKIEVPEHAHVLFVMPMPTSWSKKKRKAHLGQKHGQTPDVDNLEKALLDALYGDDRGVWDIRASKVWGSTGAILVREMAPFEVQYLNDVCAFHVERETTLDVS